MLLPIVTEILHRREPVTRDPFIAGLGAAAVTGPSSTRGGPTR
jgi:hypothetical protein